MLIYYVLPLIVAAGVLGGLINAFSPDTLLEKQLSPTQYVMRGVAAALLVPFFLHMISSNLIIDISGDVMTPQVMDRLLELTGFCLAASISSRAFIRTVTGQMLSRLKDVESNAKRANEKSDDAEEKSSAAQREAALAVAKATQAVALTSDTQEADESPIPGAAVSEVPEVSELEGRVLLAMVGSEFSRRTLSGLAQELALTRNAVRGLVQHLAQVGLLEEVPGKKDEIPRWRLTGSGREFAFSLVPKLRPTKPS